MSDEERQKRLGAVARAVMAQLYAAGDESFVGESVHAVVMMWIDERVIALEDADLHEVTDVLGRLAGKMRRRREQLGLDPTKVDPEGES